MTMDLSPPQVGGLFLIALFAVALGWIFLGKQPLAIKLFSLALLIVGLGYLATTNVPIELVRAVFGEQY